MVLMNVLAWGEDDENARCGGGGDGSGAGAQLAFRLACLPAYPPASPESPALPPSMPCRMLEPPMLLCYDRPSPLQRRAKAG